MAQNNVPGEFIIQLHQGFTPDQFDKESLSQSQNTFVLTRNLSKRFNIWLCASEQGNETAKLKDLQAFASVKVAQFNHYVQLR